MKARRANSIRLTLFCMCVAALLASTLFVSSAEKTEQVEVLPHELDVRVAGGVLRGGSIEPRAKLTSKGVAEQNTRQALAQSRTADASQSKALNSLEHATGAKLSVEYNPLTGTPRHMFARSGYLSPRSSDVPEDIARDFISDWQGLFRFTESDLENLKLKSRTTLPDLGATILLFEQQVEGVPVYKGEVMVNINREGQVINVGGDNYPQLRVSNSVSLTPAQAIVSAAKSLGFDGFVPQQLGSKKVPRTFGNLKPELIDAPRFSGAGVFSDDIVVTHVIFPMGAEGRHAYNFALTTPRYRGIMWNNIVDAQTGEVLRRTSLTSFQSGGGPITSRRATFRPDVQNLVEANSMATASGKVFDGMPSALAGRHVCSGNLPGRPCNGAAGTGGTVGPGYGRSTAPGDRPDYQTNETELDRNNGRGFKESLVAARTENPYSIAGGPLVSQIYNTPYGQVLRGFPDAVNPTSPRYGSRFGWFYLPTGTGGTEIAEADNNRASTRAYKYEMPAEAVTRNLAANSPVADKTQPFAADLTPLSSPVTLRDGRVLSSVFQSRYTEGNNTLVADDRFNDNETTSGIRGYSANRQFTASYFDFLNGYEYGGEDAKSAIPETMGLVACTVINLCEVYYYPPSTQQDVYPGTATMFYYTNILHDYLYSIGFTEATWNFQQDNFGLGGAGQDALSAQVQDGSGTDNANMSTGNDGSPPRMQMFLFTEPVFRRADGDFDFDVVGHEFYHGVSNRSAGKGTADCLGTPLVGESGGQGEGWSDFIACSMTDDDAEGEYVTGEFDIGIRRLPYTNYRWSYGSLNGNGLNRRDQGAPDPDPGSVAFEVHDVGEVFAAMLWDMRELMIMKDPNGVFFDGTRRLGTLALPTNTEFYIGPRKVRSVDLKHPIDYRPEFNTTVPGATFSGQPSPPGGIVPPEAPQTQVPFIKGNEHIIRPGLLTAEIQANGNRNGALATAVANGARLADTLVLRGLQLSPCNPSIVATRDSILLADEELTGGENRAIIWRAFASHGVGTNASSDSQSGQAVEDFTVPAGVTACEQSGPLAAPTFSLANTAANRVTVTINGGVPVAGAAQYTITRSFKAEGPFTKIAEIPAATTVYQDENLSGGQTYFYQVRASRDTETICVSTANTLSIAVTNGIVITPPPTFFGADQVIDPVTGTTLVVKWNSAITPNPAGDAFTLCSDCVYDIYRVEHVEPGDGTQEPTFTPSDSNRIAQGVTGNQFTDTARQLGQIYYYIVQARNTAGKKDTGDVGNRTVRYNIPTVATFKTFHPFPLENYESSSADARFQPPLQESGDDPKEDQPAWQRVTNIPFPGTTSATMYAPDYDPGPGYGPSDSSTVIGPLTLSATSVMDFDHFFSLEARFDGGVLEIAKGGPNFNSTPYPDNVTTFELANYIVEGPYNSKLDGDLEGAPGTALLGRRAYSGIKGAHHVRVSLGEFAPGGDNNPEGATIYLRFRVSTDVGTTNGAEAGWYIDNLVIHDLGVNTTPAPGALQFSAASYNVGESGGSATITVTRVSGSDGAVSVDYATSNGTATAGSDYASASGTLNFANGETSKTFSVPVTDDALDEADETVNLTLSNPTGGATLGTPNAAVLTITDNDPLPSLSINDVSANEGNSGTTNFTFTVTLSAASGRSVTVDYATVPGTATAGSDYVTNSNTLTFSPGDTTKTITVVVNGDTANEANETFSVNLTNAQNASISDSAGAGTILNDDAPTVQFSAPSYTVGEGDVRVSLTVNRSGDSSGAATVNFATVDEAGLQKCDVNNGIASQKCDFGMTFGTLSWAAGDASPKMFSMPIIDDSYADGQEKFKVTLSNASGAAISSPSVDVTISDNDASTGTNPIDGSSFFIRLQYLDFLNREPESDGMAFYLDILNGCRPSDAECIRYTRGAVSANFFRSPEFQQKGSFVLYLYMITLGQRPATVAELSDSSKIDRPHYLEFLSDVQYISHPNDDKAIESVLKDALSIAWLQRPEVQQVLPSSLSNEQFVKKLESTAGVTLSNESTLIANLNNGSQTRPQVLRAVAEHEEINAKFFKQAFVTMEYFGYLRRDPEDCHNSQDPANCGFIFHNTRFSLITDPHLVENFVVRGFIESPEYRQRFGP